MDAALKPSSAGTVIEGQAAKPILRCQPPFAAIGRATPPTPGWASREPCRAGLRFTGNAGLADEGRVQDCFGRMSAREKMRGRFMASTSTDGM